MTVETLQLSEALHRYLLDSSLRESALLRQLRMETAAEPLARMQVAPEQGQLLAFLVELIGARRALEVGVFTGYSSLAVALALPGDGRLVACDNSVEWTTVARRYWAAAGVADKVDLRLGPALETLDGLLAAGEGDFDFAFLDADKENYLAYYERLLALLRSGGLLAIDNTLWSGRVIDPTDQDPSTQGIRALNAHLHADPRVSLTMLPLADGLTLVRKRG